jgi:Ran GTPase-activating protein (RanGAP) involved in mRNA processing and transport
LNNIGEKGVESIAEALKFNSSLQEIDLSANSIRAEGDKSVEESIVVNSSLQEINFRSNSIGVGFKSVSGALKQLDTAEDLSLTK